MCPPSASVEAFAPCLARNILACTLTGVAIVCDCKKPFVMMKEKQRCNRIALSSPATSSHCGTAK